MKNEDFNPQNVNTWNGCWYCPFCKGPVGSSNCSCETSWMIVKDQYTVDRLIVFYKAYTLQSFRASDNGRKLSMASVKKIYFISEEGEIGSEAAKQEVFNTDSIEKRAEDYFPAP